MKLRYHATSKQHFIFSTFFQEIMKCLIQSRNLMILLRFYAECGQIDSKDITQFIRTTSLKRGETLSMRSDSCSVTDSLKRHPSRDQQLCIILTLPLA